MTETIKVNVGPYTIEAEPYDDLPAAAFDAYWQARSEAANESEGAISSQEGGVALLASMDRHLFRSLKVTRNGQPISLDKDMPHTVATVIVALAGPPRKEILDLGKFLADLRDGSGTD